MIVPVKTDQCYMGRLNRGDDLLLALTEILKQNKVHLGWIQALGAVEEAVVGYFDQQAKAYRSIVMKQPMEIASLTGNISLKDDEPFLHAHITLADEAGVCHGGHLMQGCIVFACEFVIQSADGKTLRRQFDETTKLSLWPD